MDEVAPNQRDGFDVFDDVSIHSRHFLFRFLRFYPNGVRKQYCHNGSDLRSFDVLRIVFQYNASRFYRSFVRPS